MANTRGVFTLQDVRYAQEDDVWVSPDEAFYNNITSTPNVSYWAGGTTPAEVSSIDKCNFTTETTALLPGINLPSVNSTQGGLSNKDSGFWFGGRTPSFSSAVSKISYGSETVSQSPASQMSNARQDSRGTANQSHGYFTGGYNSGDGYQSTVDKFIFATETTFRFPSAALITQRNVHGALGNQTYCYLMSGYNGSGYIDTTDRIVFGTDTTSRIPATFGPTRGGVTGASTDTIGYVSGGVASGPTFYSTVNKFTFSTETSGTLPSTNSLPASLQNNGGAATPSLGYFGGGKGSGPAINTMCKINSADDTLSNVPGANLTATRYNFSAVTPRGQSRETTGYIASTQNLKNVPFSNYGYYQGGYTPFSYTQRIDYTTESNGLLPSANNTQGNIDAHSGSSSNTAAYFGLGSAPGGVSTIVNKLTYLTEAMVAVPGASFPTPGRYDPAALTSFTNGYFGGGFSPGPTIHSKIEKLNYASETSSSMPATKLVTGRYHLGSAGNTTQGYFVQGITPSDYSNIEKLVYSTDTISQAISAATNIRSYIAGTSTESAGYFGGGSGNTGTVSFISKLSFPIDTWSQTPANLNTARYNVESVGNTKTNGYFMGGWQYVTTTERISYASETVAAVPSGSLISGTNDGATASLLDYGRPYAKAAPTPTLNVSYTQITTPFTGYTAGGGGPGGRTSNYYKLLYATETGSFLPSTNLTSSRATYLCGYSNTEKGYTAGGYFGSPFFVAESWVDRVTYSSDTSVTVPGAYLPSPGRYGGTSGSSPSAGYYVAGYNTGALNSTLKMPFSSETHSTLPSSANLSSARYYFCGGGGPDKGYFGGGYPTTTNMDKLIYSTDTMTASPSTNLFGASDSTTRGTGALVGNSRDAYLATGQNPGSPAPVPNYGYKINFSTDTSRIISGIVVQPRQSVAGAFGHELQGYFCGGIVPSPYATVTIVDKITYATEVSQLVPTAYMPEDRSGASSMSARNFGASGGGTSNIL